MSQSFSGSEIDDQAADTAGQDKGDITAQPPGADQGVTDQSSTDAKPFDALAVTRQALETTKPDADAGTEGAPGPDANKDQADAAPKGEADASKSAEQDDANLPFGKHPRFREVITQRNDARRQVADLEPDAAAYREVTDFMRTSSLKAEEVQQGFAIMAALKNNPAEAWKMLQPHVTRLQQVMGLVLPDDLRARLDDGLVDQETASELARRRATDEHTATVARERAAINAADAQARLGTARAEAVDTFIADRQTNDPDFALKQPLLRGAILEAIEQRRASGKPVSTPAEAVEVVAGAYKGLNDRIAALRGGQRREQKPTGRTPPSGMSSATPARPAPRTSLDITRAALAGV